MGTNLNDLVTLVIVFATIGLVTAAVVSYIDSIRDPDHDGISTYKDPHPYEYDGSIDSDGDGWTNHHEQHIGTDLTNPDEDEDGLLDGADADGDGMSNWFEQNVAGLDPLVTNDRYYVQLMATPPMAVNETLNYEFWIADERIEPEHYIVQYNVTIREFQAIVRDLSEHVTENDLVYIYLKTHGSKTNGTANEPVLCFANETYPTEFDKFGAPLSYEELTHYLDTIQSKYMVVVYSSCAETAAVSVLAESSRPRAVIATLGVLAGIPAEDALNTVSGTSGSYFSLMDVIDAIRQDPTNKFTISERVSDRDNIAPKFFFGDYPRALFREGHVNLEKPGSPHRTTSTWNRLFGYHDAWSEAMEEENA